MVGKENQMHSDTTVGATASQDYKEQIPKGLS